MAEALNKVGAITMFIEDTQRSKSFYQHVFDSSPIYEDDDAVAFQFENMVVNLLRHPAARELIDPGVVSTGQDSSRFVLTIWVEDTDAVIAELAERGVRLLNGPMNRAWGMRTASFKDPDGHIWEVAQSIREGAAEGSH